MKKYTTLFVLFVALLSLVQRGYSLTSSWTNAAGGNWSVAGNWDNGVPTIGDSAVIDLAGTYTVALDQDAVVSTVVLGDSGFAHATLEIAVGWSLTTGDSGISPCFVDTNCVLDLYGTILPVRGPFDFLSYPITNYGSLFIRGTGFLNGANNADGIESRETGTITIENGGSILNTDFIISYGYLFVNGVGSIVDGLIFNQPGGSVIVNGSITTRDIINNGSFSLTEGGTVYLALDEFFDPATFTNNSSVAFTGGNSFIDGDTVVGVHSSFLNNGTLQVLIDTSEVNDFATIGLAIDFNTPGIIHFSTGNLSLTSPYSLLLDSIYIAASCTLRVLDTDFSSTAAVAGMGTVHFVGGDMNVGGAWYFGGGLLLYRDVDWVDPVVIFNPELVPAVSLNSLTIIDDGQFIPPSFDIDIDTVSQFGGVLGGNVVPNSTYGWAAGTINHSNENVQSLTIPFGVDFSVYGSGSKTLDSIDLRVEGTASFSGTGVMTLLDSARVYLDPGAFSDFTGQFTLSGVGDLYNSGDLDFDPQLDTILIDVPVINSTIARTPGTIDILTRPVVWGAGGYNGATITIFDQGQLVIDGSFVNAGLIDVQAGGELNLLGQMIMSGNSSVSGSGVFNNDGTIESQGGMVSTLTNIPVQPMLFNNDSGSLTIQADTLTLLQGGVNRGVITILAGSVLKVFGTFINDSTGVIQGGGVLDVSAATFSNFGTISPGMSPGALAITGNVVLSPSSVLQIELNGASNALYDHLNITGSVQLDGMLALSVQSGYIPSSFDSLRFLTCGALSGTFQQTTGTTLSNGDRLNLNFWSGGVVINVIPGLALVVRALSPGSQSMRLIWHTFPSATEYSVYSCETRGGTYSLIQTVAAPDTAATVVRQAGHLKRYYRVTATLP